MGRSPQNAGLFFVLYFTTGYFYIRERTSTHQEKRKKLFSVYSKIVNRM